MKTIEEKTHAKFSPSSAHRWINCPGSIKLSEDAPKQPDSPYAKEGTDAHKCLEILLLSPGSEKALRKKYSDEMVDHALWAVEQINKLAPIGSKLLVETKVRNDFIDKDFHGTLDVAIVDEFGDLFIIDYKYGAGLAVEAKENHQLIAYAMGVAHKYDYNFKEARLVILQPRAFHSDGPVRIWTLPISELKHYWRVVFTHRIESAKEKNPVLKAGDWCRFCPGAINRDGEYCPEISDRALAAAKADFDLGTGELDLPKPELISNESLGTVLRAMEKIEFWIAQTRAYAFNVLNSGSEVPGFKLVPKRAQRKWINEAKAEKEAQKKFGLKAFTVPSLLSPAQLEKVASKEWVDERCTQVSSALALVSDSDKREASNQLDLDFKTPAIENQKSTKPKKPTKGKK